MENSSFTVLPMSQRFYLEPGKTYEGKLSVVNPADSAKELKYKVSVTPYGVYDDYSADLVSMTGRTEIAKWISFKEPSGTIEPNNTKEVEFTITVPENAPAGGQYATIAVASESEPNTESGVAVNNIFELASIVYGTVSGETKHGGEILENNVPGFSTSSPVKVSALISNTGNIHEDATFTLTVTDVFSGRVILPTDDMPGQYNEVIMPETTREIVREVGDLPAIGVVKITQRIYYINGEFSEVSKDVLICPIWFMVILGLTIISIIAAIVAIIFKHKKHKRVVA